MAKLLWSEEDPATCTLKARVGPFTVEIFHNHGNGLCVWRVNKLWVAQEGLPSVEAAQRSAEEHFVNMTLSMSQSLGLEVDCV